MLGRTTARRSKSSRDWCVQARTLTALCGGEVVMAKKEKEQEDHPPARRT